MATILSQTGETFSFDKNFPLDTGSQTKQAEPSLQLASLLSDQPFKEMVTPNFFLARLIITLHYD